jgi:hypothetical protein
MEGLQLTKLSNLSFLDKEMGKVDELLILLLEIAEIIFPDAVVFPNPFEEVKVITNTDLDIGEYKVLSGMLAEEKKLHGLYLRGSNDIKKLGSVVKANIVNKDEGWLITNKRYIMHESGEFPIVKYFKHEWERARQLIYAVRARTVLEEAAKLEVTQRVTKEYIFAGAKESNNVQLKKNALVRTVISPYLGDEPEKGHVKQAFKRTSEFEIIPVLILDLLNECLFPTTHAGAILGRVPWELQSYHSLEAGPMYFIISVLCRVLQLRTGNNPPLQKLRYEAIKGMFLFFE